MRKIILIAHDIRSAHNVGSLLRTADGLGVEVVYLSGITPYPPAENDERLPHVKYRAANLIKKTALGAENTQAWRRTTNISSLIANLRRQGYKIYGLEQTEQAVNLNEFTYRGPIALILGNEVKGLDQPLLKQLDGCTQIIMLGKKESFNVVQAAAMALYHLRFIAS